MTQKLSNFELIKIIAMIFIVWTDYFKYIHYNELIPIILNLSFIVISSYLICTLIDHLKKVTFDKYILSKIFSIKYLDKIEKNFTA